MILKYIYSNLCCNVDISMNNRLILYTKTWNSVQYCLLMFMTRITVCMVFWKKSSAMTVGVTVEIGREPIVCAVNYTSYSIKSVLYSIQLSFQHFCGNIKTH